jgi:hypothetical protein
MQTPCLLRPLKYTVCFRRPCRKTRFCFRTYTQILCFLQNFLRIYFYHTSYVPSPSQNLWFRFLNVVLLSRPYKIWAFFYSIIQYFQQGWCTLCCLWLYSERLPSKSLHFVFFCGSKRASKRRNNSGCAWITSSVWWEPCSSCYLLSLSVLHNRLPCDLIHHLTLHPSEPTKTSVSSAGWSLAFNQVSLRQNEACRLPLL